MKHSSPCFISGDTSFVSGFDRPGSWGMLLWHWRRLQEKCLSSLLTLHRVRRAKTSESWQNGCKRSLVFVLARQKCLDVSVFYSKTPWSCSIESGVAPLCCRRRDYWSEITCPALESVREHEPEIGTRSFSWVFFKPSSLTYPSTPFSQHMDGTSN